MTDDQAEEDRRCGPFDVRDQQNIPGPSRRTLLGFGALGAAAYVAASVGGSVGAVSPAAAEPAWNHPLWDQGRITSGFGYRPPPCPGCSTNHKGLDYVLNGPGTPIYSVAAGTVRDARAGTGSYGNFVEIDHGGGFTSLSAHMQDGSLSVSTGDLISAGTRLGGMGATGNVDGVHLHIELRQNNVPFDPRSRIHNATLVKNLKTQPPTQEMDLDMYIVSDPNGPVYLAGSGGLIHVQTPDHLAVLEAMVYRRRTSFSITELKIITGYMNALRTTVLSIPG